jgi:phosphomevalonate decarboxylase
MLTEAIFETRAIILEKVTVIAHPIQGLVKYHGLRDASRRIPFHDSISVCLQEMWTKTTVEAIGTNTKDEIILNGWDPAQEERNRIEIVINCLRALAQSRYGFRISSMNSLRVGKGLGFSSSGFAALGVAISKALGLDLDPASLSEAVRLGSASATRSLAGGFSILYANKDGHSYAEMITEPEEIRLKIIVVPIPHQARTEEAHRSVVDSPFFHSRLQTVERTLDLMKKAILQKDVRNIGRLAEEDSLSLHAVTMTGRPSMMLMKPETLLLIDKIKELRSKGLDAWFSLDTGPSVFINTHPENVVEISNQVETALGLKTVVSDVGGPPQFSNAHLF